MLGMIDGFQRDDKQEYSLSRNLQSADVSPEHAENQAWSMKSKMHVGEKKGKRVWSYQGANGVVTYSDLYATLRNWSKRPPLQSSSNATNGHYPQGSVRPKYTGTEPLPDTW